MGSRKNPDQKGSGAKKHGRNYRARFQEKFRTQLTVTQYRARHGIPNGSRKDNHRQGLCPLHRKR